MTYGRESWKRVATRLAGRLSHATDDFCAAHKDPEEDPDCPFCQDILAYRAYRLRASQELYP